MKDVTYTPVRDARRALAVVGLFVLLGILCMVTAALVPVAKAVFELIFVFAAVFAIFFAVKLIVTTYSYTITDRYGPVMVVITQTTGRRVSVMGRIPCENIRSVSEPGEKVAARAGLKRYDYTSNLGAAGKYTLCATVDGSDIAVRIQVDAEFIAVLRSLMIAPSAESVE